MKQCPYCNAQIADDSKFCGECGKEYPQENVCPKCGAAVNEDDIYCEICGRNLKDGSNVSVNDGKSSIDYMKILLSSLIGIIVGIVILAIIGGGWYGCNEYTAYKERAVAREKFVADSLEKARKDSLRRIELAEQQRADSLFRQESKHFVESFYTVLLKRNGNDKIIEQSITLHAKKILIQLYRDCWGGDENFMATWVFTKEYHDSPISDVYSFRVSEQEKGQYLVSIRYEYSETEYSEYDVLLTIVKEENTYKVDNVEKKRVFYNMKTSEDEDYYG